MLLRKSYGREIHLQDCTVFIDTISLPSLFIRWILSVPTSILSYMIQNTVDVVHITTLDNKNEKIMWKRNSYLFTGIMIHALITKKQQ